MRNQNLKLRHSNKLMENYRTGIFKHGISFKRKLIKILTALKLSKKTMNSKLTMK